MRDCPNLLAVLAIITGGVVVTGAPSDREDLQDFKKKIR